MKRLNLIQKRILEATAISICIAVGGCSAYRFGTQIGDFSDGVTGLADSLGASETVLNSDRMFYNRAAYAQSRPQLELSESCFARISEKAPACAIFDSRRPPIPPSVTPMKVTPRQAARMLRDYADGLKAVTYAKDRADLDGAAAKLFGAIQRLTGGVPALAPLPAVLSAAQWLFGEALDTARFYALKKALNSAQPGIEALAKEIGAELKSDQAKRARILQDTATLIAKGMTQPQSRADWLARYDMTDDRVGALDAVMRADPEKATEELIKAHKALVDAVNNPTIDVAALAAEVQAFGDHVNAVRAAFAAPAKK